ncbi:nucleoside deaminase [Deinococcus sp. YIM 134068]|uniref:nucleoside deaminase n=1 Tax=Deinococcus lichenicola TaxID=3118910 RepID=UPI002F9398D8
MTPHLLPLTQGWHAALSQAWTAYLHGSYPIGAVIVDASGAVIARGRNRLGEGRSVAGGFISGHDLAHAEINALLDLAATPCPECYGWTLLTTVQPCPQCAGAVAMSGLRALEYAAPDPWAGCTRLLTDDPYVSRKGIRMGRAPEEVQRAALRLVLTAFLEEATSSDDPVLRAFSVHAEDYAHAARLSAEGTLRRLRERGAELEDVLEMLA